MKIELGRRVISSFEGQSPRENSIYQRGSSTFSLTCPVREFHWITPHEAAKLKVRPLAVQSDENLRLFGTDVSAASSKLEDKCSTKDYENILSKRKGGNNIVYKYLLRCLTGGALLRGSLLRRRRMAYIQFGATARVSRTTNHDMNHVTDEDEGSDSDSKGKQLCNTLREIQGEARSTMRAPPTCFPGFIILASTMPDTTKNTLSKTSPVLPTYS